MAPDLNQFISVTLTESGLNMALSRQRAHERRVHALELENQDLRKDVDKLEDALALHTSTKQADELSVKGIIRNEIGGSIWQHGGEGKLTSYKSAKDLKNKYGLRPEESRNSKRKANENIPKQGKHKGQIKSELSNESKAGNKTRSDVHIPGSGSNIGTKSHAVKSSGIDRLANKHAGDSGFERAGKTYKVEHRGIDRSDDSVLHSAPMNQTYNIRDVQSGKVTDRVTDLLSVSPVHCPKNVENDYDSQRSKVEKTENRIEVLNTMIEKLRESWHLEGGRSNSSSSTEEDTNKNRDAFVVEWLSSLDLKNPEKYIDKFIDNEIDRGSLKLLDEHKLRCMGISAVGPLTKILRGIEELKKNGAKKGKKGELCGDDVEQRQKTGSQAVRPDSTRVKKTNAENRNTVTNSDKTSPVQVKSVLTTKSGKNTFSPKALLTTLECISNVESDRSEENSKTSGRVSMVTGDTVSSLAKQKSVESVRSNSGVSSTRPSSVNLNRGSGTSAGNSGRLQRQGEEKKSRSSISMRTLSAVSKKGVQKSSKTPLKENETEFVASCLDGVVGIRTAVQDVSVDQTDTEDGENTPATGEGVSSTTDPLQTIEDQIVSLSSNQKQPEALDKINFLQERLREIRAEIEQKARPVVDREDVPSEDTEACQRDNQQVLVKNDVELNAEKAFLRPRTKTPPPTEKSRNYKTKDRDKRTKQIIHERGESGNQPKVELREEPGTVASRNMSKSELLKHVRKQKDQHRKQIRHLESELSRLKHKDPLRSCEICLTDLQYTTDDLIGEGGFSRVFHGKYQGSDVAVKRLKVPLSAQDKNYFMAEVNLLKDLRHPRVVLLVGVCTTSPLPLMVLEFMARGSLYHHLHNPDNMPLDHLAFYQIAKDTALGMNYLHLHKPAVLHLDLKSMNVLLTQQLRAKIADFGFSKLRHDADVKAKQGRGASVRSAAKSHVKGTPAWLAPEMLDFKEVTAKADVYSFGIILWEMLTRKRPYAGYSVFQVIEAVRTNKRPLIPEDCPDQLCELITRCWDKNPAKRPQFKDILLTLDLLHLPTEWRQLFEDAGVAMETLSDINTTRSLVNLVSTTMTQMERPPDVPVLELYDSDTEEKGHMMMLGLSSDDNSDCELPPSEREAQYLELPATQSKHTNSGVCHNNMQNTDHTYTPKAMNGGVKFSKSSGRGGVKSCSPKQEVSRSHDLKEEVAFYDQLAEALQSWQETDVDQIQTTFRVNASVNDKKTQQEGLEDETGVTVGSREGETPVSERGVVGLNGKPEVEVKADSYGTEEVINNTNNTKASSPVKKGLHEKDKSRSKSTTPSFSKLQQRNSRPSTSQSSNVQTTSQHHLSTKTKPPLASEVTLAKRPMIQPSLASELRASKLVAQRTNLKATANQETDQQKPREPLGGEQSRSSIRTSMLVEQRGRLKGTDVPHPRQLPNLGKVGQSQMFDLANILKRAVNERRVAMGDAHTMESLGSGTWSVED